MSLKKALVKMKLMEDEVVSVPTKAKATTPTTTYVPPTVQTPEIDATFAKALEQSLQESKLSGFDYLKFISTTEEMKTYGTPEETRFKMAFSAAKQIGMDKGKLVDSGQHYLDVLKQDEAEFNAECTRFEKEEIQSKETRISQLDTKVASLSEQLTKATQDRATLAEEVQEKKTGLDTRRASFQTTLKSFVSTIEANIAKINTYLN